MDNKAMRMLCYKTYTEKIEGVSKSRQWNADKTD